MARILIADADTHVCGCIYGSLSKRQTGQSVELTTDCLCASASLLSNEYDPLPNFSVGTIRKLRARGVKTKIVVLCDLASPRPC